MCRVPRFGFLPGLCLLLGAASWGFPTPSELPLSYLLEESSREAALIAVHLREVSSATDACLKEQRAVECELAARLFARYPGTGVAYREIVWRLSHLPSGGTPKPSEVARGLGKPPFASYARIAEQLTSLKLDPLTQVKVKQSVQTFLERDLNTPHTLEQARARARILNALQGSDHSISGEDWESRLVTQKTEDGKREMGEWAKQIQTASQFGSLGLGTPLSAPMRLGRRR